MVAVAGDPFNASLPFLTDFVNDITHEKWGTQFPPVSTNHRFGNLQEWIELIWTWHQQVGHRKLCTVDVTLELHIQEDPEKYKRPLHYRGYYIEIIANAVPLAIVHRQRRWQSRPDILYVHFDSELIQGRAAAQAQLEQAANHLHVRLRKALDKAYQEGCYLADELIEGTKTRTTSIWR